MRIPFDTIVTTLTPILQTHGFSHDRARACAEIFAGNSRDGVAPHGLDRFTRFVDFLRKGLVDPTAEPTVVSRHGGMERWDGHCGPGMLNALAATDRAMELADECGIGCVAVRNTNHWLRPGSYGWRAAEAGYLFACWTNTQPNMIPWKAFSRVVGNNPIVFAFPRAPTPIVLDMSLSQFSMGRLAQDRRDGRTMPVPAGYDKDGKETCDPGKVMDSGNHLPIGYWKGAGLALLLDLFAAGLSGGQSTAEISRQETENAVSQVFLAWSAGDDHERLNAIADAAIEDLRATVPADGFEELRYPGERALQCREESNRLGVPVDPDTWEKIGELGLDW
jgi:3-dehydro-L-gulonate 2-dehydrogenase